MTVPSSLVVMVPGDWHWGVDGGGWRERERIDGESYNTIQYNTIQYRN